VTTAPEKAVIDIVLVDDHAIVRQGLRAILEREGDMQVVAEAASPAEALAVVAASRPRVVLLDLKLSARSDDEGLALCRELTRALPGVAVLVLTTLLDEHLVLQAIHNGACGYVVKDVDTAELVRAIRSVAEGGSAFDSRSAAAMVRSLKVDDEADSRRLTDRELEVLRMLAQGRSNREIGARLYISESTVKFHVRNLMRKLAVSSRAEAAYTASKLRVI
jgi:DNA-binding NarL/FixJ family response regulator